MRTTNQGQRGLAHEQSQASAFSFHVMYINNRVRVRTSPTEHYGSLLARVIDRCACLLTFVRRSAPF